MSIVVVLVILMQGSFLGYMLEEPQVHVVSSYELDWELNSRNAYSLVGVDDEFYNRTNTKLREYFPDTPVGIYNWGRYDIWGGNMELQYETNVMNIINNEGGHEHSTALVAVAERNGWGSLGYCRNCKVVSREDFTQLNTDYEYSIYQNMHCGISGIVCEIKYMNAHRYKVLSMSYTNIYYAYGPFNKEAQELGDEEGVIFVLSTDNYGNCNKKNSNGKCIDYRWLGSEYPTIDNADNVIYVGGIESYKGELWEKSGVIDSKHDVPQILGIADRVFTSWSLSSPMLYGISSGVSYSTPSIAGLMAEARFMCDTAHPRRFIQWIQETGNYNQSFPYAHIPTVNARAFLEYTQTHCPLKYEWGNHPKRNYYYFPVWFFGE